jgi:hypothetical protein
MRSDGRSGFGTIPSQSMTRAADRFSTRWMPTETTTRPAITSTEAMIEDAAGYVASLIEW